MKRMIVRLVVCAACFMGARLVRADDNQEPATGPASGRIAVSLTDGTRLLCTPEADKIPIEMSYANVSIPLTNVQRIVFGKAGERQTELILKNGDRLTGRIPLEILKVKTLFGDVTLTLSTVTELSTGSTQAVEPAKMIADTPQNRQRCVNNMRLIDHAKEVVSIKHNLGAGAIVTPDQISPYIDGGIQKLKCPSGGTYKLNPVDTVPECSVPGHVYKPF